MGSGYLLAPGRVELVIPNAVRAAIAHGMDGTPRYPDLLS